MPSDAITEAGRDVRRTAMVAAYIATQNASEVARQFDVTEAAIRRAMATEWWAQTEAELLEQIKASHRRKYVELVDRAQDAALDRLEHGDEVIDRQGTSRRIRVRGRDAAIIGSIAFDKLRLLDGLPTRITSQSGALDGLMAEFRRLGDSYRHGNVINQPQEQPKPLISDDNAAQD